MKSKLNNEKGVTLVLVVCIFMFVSIISLGLITVASSEGIQGYAKNDDIQAEFISVSGIEIMADYIVNHQGVFETKYAAGSNFPLTLNIEDGTANIDIEDVGNDLRVKSYGNYRGDSEYKSAIIKKIDTTPYYMFYKDFIDTNVLTGYIPLAIPAFDESRGGLTVTSSQNIVGLLDKDVIEYDNITVNSGGQLSFNTGVNNRTVIVDNIVVNGAFNLADDGKVFLIVKNDATFNSKFLNANENLVILLDGNGTITINSPTDFNAYIFAKDGTVNLNGSTNFKGSIISKNYTKVASANLEYIAPTDILSLKTYIKYNETYIYEFDDYEK